MIVCSSTCFGTVITFMGDSISNFCGVCDERSYPEILRRELGVEIDNKSYDGMITKECDQVAIHILACAYKPDIVVINLRDIDKISPEKSSKYLEKAVRKLTYNQVKVIIGCKNTDLYRALKKAYPYVYTFNNEAVLYRESGHRMIADRLIDIIQEVM